MKQKEKLRVSTYGTKTLNLALPPDTEFKNVVAYLERALTIPDIPGVRGCAPCLSGLDRLVIESPILKQLG